MFKGLLKGRLSFGACLFLALAFCALAQGKSKPCPTGNRPGACAPNLQFTSSAGKPVNLASFKGKTVILNFWATWCPPCLEEMPLIAQSAAKLDAKKVVWLMVAVDKEGPDKVMPFLKGRNLKGLNKAQQLFDVGARQANRMNTYQYPETYIIDPDGRIQHFIEGPRNWSDDIYAAYFELLAERRNF